MFKVGLLGDTHGSPSAVVHALERFKSQGITKILQLGDFGFSSSRHGQIFQSLVNSKALKMRQTIYVTPGNHEDYNYIDRLPIREDGWMQASSAILAAPRGHRWTWEGVSFVSLGGAPSVDRTFRIQQQRKIGAPLWWEQEAITAEDVERTVSGGYADIMLAHDAPYGVESIESRIANNPHGFALQDLYYAGKGRHLMLQAVDVVRPKIFFHGHYHFPVSDTLELFNENSGLTDEVRICGFGADGEPGSSGSLNLKDLKVEYWK